MRNYKAKDVDEFIANAPKEAQLKLREIRAVIKAAVPEAIEGISWGVPFYKDQGILAGFAPFKNHVSFGLAFVLDSKDRGKLLEKGYTTGKKTIQIKFDQKVPARVIKQMLIRRLAPQAGLAGKAKGNVAKRATK